MGNDDKPQIVIECRASYLLTGPGGNETAGGGARVRLDEENLSILPEFGEALFLPLRDVQEISEDDYKIHLSLTSGEKLTLSDLGYQYEDFLRMFSRQCNEILLKDLLMTESLKKSGIDAQLAGRGKCELRLYETALVVIPEKGELRRLPYSDIAKIRAEDWTLTAVTESGEKMIFSKMGSQFDSVKKTLSDAINALSLQSQALLHELLPGTDSSVIRKTARLMKDGRAVTLTEIEAISPGLWEQLEKKLEAVGVKEEYDFLRSLAPKEKIGIGLKRGLLGGLTGEYVWFLIPIYANDAKAPGNAVSLEAASDEGGGKATYFFRLVSRKDYPNFKNIEDLHRQADEFIKRVNRAMLAINFRREPVYLTDEQLEEPQYQRYRFAVAKIPELRELRGLFIGRVIHSSPEQWKKDVGDLLKFNVSVTDDNQRWKKES